MTEEFEDKYGFSLANENCIRECEENPLVQPILYRYTGMGHYEILATTVPRYFLITVGGSNDHDRVYNHGELNKLTLNDSMTKEELILELKKRQWTEVVKTSDFEGGSVQSCIQHVGC